MLLEGLKKERWGHEGGWGVGFVTEIPAKRLGSLKNCHSGATDRIFILQHGAQRCLLLHQSPDLRTWDVNCRQLPPPFVMSD